MARVTPGYLGATRTHTRQNPYRKRRYRYRCGSPQRLCRSVRVCQTCVVPADTTPRSYKHETRLIRAFRPCPTQPDHKRDPDSCPTCPLSIVFHRTAFRTFGLHFRMTLVYVIVLPHPSGTRALTSRRLYQAYSISPRTFPVKPISRYRRLL